MNPMNRCVFVLVGVIIGGKFLAITDQKLESTISRTFMCPFIDTMKTHTAPFQNNHLSLRVQTHSGWSLSVAFLHIKIRLFYQLQPDFVTK